MAKHKEGIQGIGVSGNSYKVLWMERRKEKMEKNVGDKEFSCRSQFCVYI